MKALMMQVRESICENGEFCHALGQICLLSFGGSVIVLNVAQLT